MFDKDGGSPSHRSQSEQQQSEQSGTMARQFKSQKDGVGNYCSECGEQIADLTLGHTALKPANEPICLARRPLSEKSVAENVLKWKTGGINVDGCRVGTDPISHGTSKIDFKNKKEGSKSFYDNAWQGGKLIQVEEHITEGRFPANVILECICDEVIKGEKGEVKSNTREAGNSFNNYDENKGKIVTRIENYADKGDIHTNPDCPCRLLDEQSGDIKSSKFKEGYDGGFGAETNSYINHKPGGSIVKNERGYNDKGGASRFFYQAKVSKAERNMGLDGFEDKKLHNINQLEIFGGELS